MQKLTISRNNLGYPHTNISHLKLTIIVSRSNNTISLDGACVLGDETIMSSFHTLRSD